MHSHSHGHNHTHNDEDASRRIGWAFFLNLTFTIIEFIGGWLTNSTAIMADAIHDLGDSISIGTAWGLNKLSNKPASSQFSYGYKRFSLLGALINGLVLTVGSIFILIEAIPRLANPEMPQVEGMLLLAIFGMVVNGYAAYKLSHGKTLNERVLNWHLLEDVLGWIAIFIVSIVLMFVEWPILDPILSICFTLFILFNVVRTLKSTLMLFLQATPDIDGENNVLTAHIVLNTEISNKELKSYKLELQHELKEFDFAHTTIEIEFMNETCRDTS